VIVPQIIDGVPTSGIFSWKSPKIEIPINMQ
jgi:hypothetical protein